MQKAHLFYLNLVGYKGVVIDDLRQPNEYEFYLNLVGYKDSRILFEFMGND